MSHVTPEGRDLIGWFSHMTHREPSHWSESSLPPGKLLQPVSKERIKLVEVMQHPWITKEGAQPLYPYKYTPPDQATQKSVSLFSH